jgi:hypothetical protein
MAESDLHGRIPSKTLGLHLHGDGTALRLYDSSRSLRLPTRQEALAAKTREVAEKDALTDRLRGELEALRRLLPPGAADPAGSCGTSS